MAPQGIKQDRRIRPGLVVVAVQVRCRPWTAGAHNRDSKQGVGCESHHAKQRNANAKPPLSGRRTRCRAPLPPRARRRAAAAARDGRGGAAACVRAARRNAGAVGGGAGGTGGHRAARERDHGAAGPRGAGARTTQDAAGGAGGTATAASLRRVAQMGADWSL